MAESSDAKPTTVALPRAKRVANTIIGIVIFLALTQAIFAIQLGRPGVFLVIPLVIAGGLFATLKLQPSNRLTVALTLLPLTLLTYGFEMRIASVRPRPASAAARRGVEFDPRSLWEAILDARKSGKDAYPSMQPRALLVQNIQEAGAASDLKNHLVSNDWGVVVDGTRVLPLGGISNKHIINCNEGGTYAVYESDEHGFNNPKGIWTKDKVDAALLGDSFTQAACVGPDEDSAHWIRRVYPNTVNLGMAGNGPLLELAGLLEYVAPKKPAIVYWLYYNNDLPDLQVERQLPQLTRYLEEENGTQSLATKQPQIDAALIEIAHQIEGLGVHWPHALDSIGLTRQRTPVGLGDLLMGESLSNFGAVVRLDRLSWAVTTRIVADPLNQPTDIQYFSRILAKAKKEVEGWGGKLHFVYLPDMFYILQYKGKRQHHDREKVLNTVKELGISLIDAHPVFEAVQDPMTLRYSGESHCNPAGYKLIADLMLRAAGAEPSK